MRVFGTGVVAIAFGVALQAHAAEPSPRARNAAPDFSGFWIRPNPGYVWRLFRPLAAGVPGPVMNVDEAGHPTQAREREIGDYTNPILKPRAAAAVKAHGERERAGNVEIAPWLMCRPSGLPLILNLYEPVQFLQSGDQVTILYQRDLQVRHIALNRPLPDPARVAPSWYGTSVGHYEGNDTLVVDTIGVDAKGGIDRLGTPHSDKMRVTERYRREPDGLTITVILTVEDPETFTTPWSAWLHYERTTGPIAERICAVNPIDPATKQAYPIPIAAVPDF